MIGEMFGPYRLDSLLGRGGMGEVYRAFDTQQNRVVALKLLPADLSADPEYRARFRREARTAAMLREPHVIPIHRFDEIDGCLFLDMRLVEGSDLGRLLTAGPIGPGRAVAILEQVASALDAAHDEGLIHRDVKPANVLLVDTRADRPDFAYLADFGIARHIVTRTGSALTRTGSMIGTLAYMAPERFLDQPVGRQVDVYALACVLHECLIGQPPFPAGEVAGFLHGHLMAEPPRVSARDPSLAALDDVIVTGLAKNPADRPERAGDLMDAARSALSRAGPRRVPATAGTSAEPSTTRVGGRRRPSTGSPPTMIGSVLRGHDGAVNAVCATTVSGAPVVVTAGDDRTIRLLDMGSGQWIGAPLIGHSDQIITLAPFLGDTSTGLLASGDLAGEVRIWDLRRRRCVTTIRAHRDAITGLALVEGEYGPVLVTAGVDRRIRRWDPTTGSSVGRPMGNYLNRHDDAVVGLGVLGQRVVSAGAAGTVRAWDLDSGRLVAGPWRTAAGPAQSMAVTTVNGEQVALTGHTGGFVQVWRMGAGEFLNAGLRGHDGDVHELAVADGVDGPVAATASADGTVRLWDVVTGDAVAVPLVGHTDWVLTVAFARMAGRRVLVSGGEDATIRLWDVEETLSSWSTNT